MNVEENRVVKIPEMYLKEIEEAIGSQIDPGDERRFSDFSELDDLTKNRARDIYYQVDEIRAIFYLKYVLKAEVDRSKIFSFLFDVILGGMDQYEWERENKQLSSSSCD